MEFNGDISGELQSILFNGMLNKDPQKRPSAKEILLTPVFRRALDDYLSRMRSVVDSKISKICAQALKEVKLIGNNNNNNNNNTSLQQQQRLTTEQKEEARKIIEAAFRNKFVDAAWIDILEDHRNLIMNSGSLSSQDARKVRTAENIVSVQQQQQRQNVRNSKYSIV